MSGAHLVPVLSDHMEPTLRGGWDYVLAAPAAGYDGEALYVLDLCDDGGECVYRCARRLDGTRRVRVWSDNPKYSLHELTAADFDRAVRGIVVGEVRMSVRLPRSVASLARRIDARAGLTQ